MVSIKKIVFNLPYLDLLGLLFLAAMAFTAFHLKSYERERQNSFRVTTCNLFLGRWVYEEKSYPMYKDNECSFVLGEFACEKYGRNDLKYQNWRWKPHDCDLPRFNGKAFLEKIKGKKLLFVGDSLNKNQWNSLLCLIESSLSPSSRKEVIRKENYLYFEAEEYNVTIAFYWSPFLVESNNDDLLFHNKENRIVRVKAIEKHARHWTDADILIFDSYLWWKGKTMTLLCGSFGSSVAIYKHMENRLRSYEMALNTWSDWLEININRTKTKLFFMSLSPTHDWYTRGEGWTVKKYCYNESEPILEEGYVGNNTDMGMMHVVESTLHKLENRGLKVQYLNITQLSDYRKDAHPTHYKKFYYSKTQLADPNTHSDCSHWCLPGVPDTWNEILYAYIMDS